MMKSDGFILDSIAHKRIGHDEVARIRHLKTGKLKETKRRPQILERRPRTLKAQKSED